MWTSYACVGLEYLQCRLDLLDALELNRDASKSELQVRLVGITRRTNLLVESDPRPIDVFTVE